MNEGRKPPSTIGLHHLKPSGRHFRLARAASDSKPDVRVFFHDEIGDCAEHRSCGIELRTGEHQRALIRLSFEG